MIETRGLWLHSPRLALEAVAFRLIPGAAASLFLAWYNATNVELVVYLGRRVIVVLPNKDVDLGIVEEGELIVTRPIRNALGCRVRSH